MSSIQQANDSTGVAGSVGGVLNAIRHSALLVLAIVGLIEIIGGYVIHTGVWPAILAVWGSGLVLVGVGGYALIWWQRQ